MAFMVIEVETNESVDQMNSYVKESGNPHSGIQEAANLIQNILAGAKDGQIIVAVRSTTSTPTASGGGSDATYNLK